MSNEEEINKKNEEPLVELFLEAEKKNENDEVTKLDFETQIEIENKPTEKDCENQSELTHKNKKLARQLSPIVQKWIQIKRYWNSILVRLIFIAIPSFHVFFLACIYNQHLLYFLYFYLGVIVLDGVWVLWKRKGRDFYWFSISFASYTIVMVVIIIMETDFQYSVNDVACETNRTMTQNIPCYNSIGLTMSVCTLTEIIVVSFIATLLVGRWIMPPSERMERDAIYYQIAGFTTLAADIIEIAPYMQNQQVVASFPALVACQVIFTISLTQFSFSLTAVKKRDMTLVGWRRLVDILFATEAWSLALALFTQEIPCYILRMNLIYSVLSSSDYSLYFFVLKNGMMMGLLFFRIITLFWRQNQAEKQIIPLNNKN